MQYKPRLDGLRCGAIVMVLLGHYLPYYVKTVSGIYGVDLFFVLSGFLITTILLSERERKFSTSYKKFISRRALRIFPIYYLAVLFFIIIGAEGIKNDWPYLLSYTYNIRAGNMRNWEYYLYSPYWSLSVEEQFYLVFPFIVLLLNNRRKWLRTVLISCIIISFLQRYFNIFHMSTGSYVNPVSNTGVLVMGAFGALLYKEEKLKEKFFQSLTAEIIMLTMLVFLLWYRKAPLFEIGFPVVNLYLVIKAAAFSYRIRIIDRLLTAKWALFVGRISYGIYIYHIIVLHFLRDYIFTPLWSTIPFDKLGYLSKLQYNTTIVEFPFVAALTILIAYLSYQYIESPVLRLKDRYFKYNTAASPDTKTSAETVLN